MKEQAYTTLRDAFEKIEAMGFKVMVPVPGGNEVGVDIPHTLYTELHVEDIELQVANGK